MLILLLLGRLVSHLEHADDVILFSTSREGLQQHLGGLARWAHDCFVSVNVSKTWALETGGPSPYDIVLHLNNRRVTFESTAKYVGMNISSSNKRLFHAHYVIQAQKARGVAAMCFAVQGLTGSLPVDLLKTLYMGRVDPHLILGADVSPDAVSSHVAELETVQLAVLRRMLGLGPRSCITPLFTETGIWSIRVRRATLCIGYLRYCRARPNTELVAAALQDSMALARLGSLSWYGDLQGVVEDLGGHLTHGVALSDALVSSAEDGIRRAMLARLNAEIAGSSRLYLLRGQTPAGLVGRAGVTMALREYMRIDRRSLRRALTRLLVSDHGLAVERLRYATRRDGIVPRHDRLCRFCRTEVEDELHAMFICEGDPALVVARQ
ncbi:hypothetical protein EXIGLDRAFT_658755, partial [Exidia glandulosa HHB12029]